ncbi:hypothetical protein B0T26DRAFT_208526 [Lasiosphaeria miniovina]|uniref:Fucose-specific lectin n=1 Tax=Lasiosphaeria miniovina TaxID=1954250 RepID=A0AA40AUF7_9PEZI|nr:uncharacterized protein B0T26DRAFT_208526 [Lasiosphaeria miniovina]KAK0722222.1 hypothetical protein B0T26DRAFT_208526 [Lasiosphaeria miniovina]
MPSDILPGDVVAIESNFKGYLFYVDSKNRLAYLLGPGAGSKNSHFEVKLIKDKADEPVYVNPEVKQIAAISWVNPTNDREIRVYYSANTTKHLSEVYLTNEGKSSDGKWVKGALQAGNKFEVKAGSSISATVTRSFDGKPTGIKVYAAEDGKVNQYDLPNISLFKTEFGDEWENPIIITSKVAGF